MKEATNRQSWASVVALLFAACFAARRVWSELLFASGEDTAATAFLALAVAAYLVWQCRNYFRFTGRFNPWGVGAILLGVTLLGFSSNQRWVCGERLASMQLLWGALVCFAHPARMRGLLFVGAILSFFVAGLPGKVGGMVALPLAQGNAMLVGWVLSALGHANEVLGTLVVSGDFELQVVDACDGLRLLWAVIVLSIGHLVPKKVSYRTVFLVMASTPAIALVLNSLRVLVASLLYARVPDTAADLVHDVSGWTVMAGAWLLPAGVIAVAERGRETTGSFSAAPFTSDSKSGVDWMRWSVVCLGLILVPAITLGYSRDERVQQGDWESKSNAVLEAIPYRVGDFIGIEESIPKRQLSVLRPDASRGMRFESGERSRDFRLVVTMHRDGSSHLGHRVDRCYRNLGWQVTEIEVGDQQSMYGLMDSTVCHLERVRTGYRERLVVYKSTIVMNGADETKSGPNGLLQVQFVFPSALEKAVRIEVVRSCMSRVCGALKRAEAGPECELTPLIASN